MTKSDDLSALRKEPFREAILQLKDLLSQDSPVFLIGAGCSKCAGLPLTTELTGAVLDSGELNETSEKIVTTIRDLFGDNADNADAHHIEDYLSEIIDLLAITDRRVKRKATQNSVRLNGTEYTAEQFRSAANEIKRAISCATKNDVSMDIHCSFVSAVHRPLRVGKAVPSSPVNYLVLNYDTLIEDALALEKIPYSDGMDGGVTGWWNPDTFDRKDIAARVLKLHGSIDWHEMPKDPLPRRVHESLQTHDTNNSQVLIWPASTKYREAQLDPFAQLMDRARRAMTPPPGLQRVLAMCGYSFRDEHINIEVDRALRKSKGNLTVIAFTADDTLPRQLETWNGDEMIRDQVLIFAKRGFFHGDVKKSSGKEDLKWWKFENFSRILQEG